MKHYKMSLCLLTWNVINQKSCFLHFNQFSWKTWKLAPARTNERLMKKVLHIWMKVKKSYLLHLLFCEEICIIFQFIRMMKYFSWGEKMKSYSNCRNRTIQMRWNLRLLKASKSPQDLLNIQICIETIQ